MQCQQSSSDSHVRPMVARLMLNSLLCAHERRCWDCLASTAGHLTPTFYRGWHRANYDSTEQRSVENLFDLLSVWNSTTMHYIFIHILTIVVLVCILNMYCNSTHVIYNKHRKHFRYDISLKIVLSFVDSNFPRPIKKWFTNRPLPNWS